MSKYLTKSWMYNTGFIPAKATPVRERQGLDSQLVSSACVGSPITEQYVPYGGGSARRPQQYNYQSNLVNADMQKLYPITLAQIDYDLPPVPTDCPCLSYLHEYN